MRQPEGWYEGCLSASVDAGSGADSKKQIEECQCQSLVFALVERGHGEDQHAHTHS